MEKFKVLRALWMISKVLPKKTRNQLGKVFCEYYNPYYSLQKHMKDVRVSNDEIFLELNNGLKFHSYPDSEPDLFIKNVNPEKLGKLACIEVEHACMPISISDMPHAYASSHCTVVPTTRPEPFSQVPVEALASGCSVIATDTGGTPEVIIHGKTGLLVKPFDSEEISKSLKLLLDNEKLRNKLTMRGKEFVIEKHSITNQIGNYITAYEEVL